MKTAAPGSGTWRRARGLVLAALAVPGLAAAQTPYESLVPGQWAVVSTNTIQDLDPCPARDCSYSAVEGVSAVVNDWCGAAFASGFGTKGGLVAWGGGHNGYFGSEIYVFDVAAQQWTRVTEPYDDGSGSVAPSCSADGIYPDGSACPTHTYDQVDYHPGTNSFVILGGTPDPVCGGCVDDRAHLFSFTTDEWKLGAHKSTGLWYGGTTGYDAARDLFWLLSPYGLTFSSYDPTEDTWQEYGTAGSLEIDGAGVVDPVRDLYLFVDARGSGRVYAIPLTAPTSGLIELATSGDTEIQTVAKLGLDWEPVSQRFFAWADGADVYVLEPPAGDWQAGTWTWTRVPPAAGNTVVPTVNQNGTYSRFRYAASVDAFLLLSSTGGPVWAYRPPAATCQSAADCTAPPVCRTAVGATCPSGACVYPAVDDGTACATDGNPCTDDVCQSGACTHAPRPGASCDDGDACTTPDTCSDAGVCVPGPDTCQACQDADSDGYGDSASSACAHPEADCDDADPAVHPGATEACSDGVDNDCDGLTDLQDGVDCPVSPPTDGPHAPGRDGGVTGASEVGSGCGCRASGARAAGPLGLGAALVGLGLERWRRARRRAQAAA